MKTACLALALCVTSATAWAQQPSFEQAVKEYRDGRWSAAYGRFITLANDGDAQAARIALFMYRHGPMLYKSQWDASDEDLELWSRLAGVPYRAGMPERVATSSAAPKPMPYRPRMLRFNGRQQTTQ